MHEPLGRISGSIPAMPDTLRTVRPGDITKLAKAAEIESFTDSAVADIHMQLGRISSTVARLELIADTYFGSSPKGESSGAYGNDRPGSESKSDALRCAIERLMHLAARLESETARLARI